MNRNLEEVLKSLVACLLWKSPRVRNPQVTHSEERGTQNEERGTKIAEPGTRNPEPGTRNHPPPLIWI